MDKLTVADFLHNATIETIFLKDTVSKAWAGLEDKDSEIAILVEKFSDFVVELQFILKEIESLSEGKGEENG